MWPRSRHYTVWAIIPHFIEGKLATEKTPHTQDPAPRTRTPPPPQPPTAGTAGTCVHWPLISSRFRDSSLRRYRGGGPARPGPYPCRSLSLSLAFSPHPGVPFNRPPHLYVSLHSSDPIRPPPALLSLLSLSATVAWYYYLFLYALPWECRWSGSWQAPTGPHPPPPSSLLGL